MKERIKRTKVALQELAASQLVVAVGETGKNDIEWMCLFLQAMLEFASPSAAVQASCPDWRKKAVGLVEICFQVAVPKKGVRDTDLFPALEPLVGKRAVVYSFSLFKKRPESDSARNTLRSCEIYRLFSWCLSKSDTDTLDNVVSSAITKVKDGGQLGFALADKGMSTEGGSPSSKALSIAKPINGTSSVSQSSVAQMLKVKDAPLVKAPLSSNDSEMQRKATLLSMFAKPSA